MVTTKVFLIYMSRPDTRYGIGGVRRFLTLFTEYANSREIKWEYFTLWNKPIEPGRLSVARNLLLAFRLLIGLLSSSKREKDRRILYAHDAIYSGFIALIVSKLSHVPLLLHYHNSPSVSYLASKPPGLTSKVGYHAIRIAEQHVLAGSDHIIATSKSLGRLITSFGVPPDRITVLPMPISVETFYMDRGESMDVRRELRIPTNAYVVGYVGRLSPEKNLNTLMEAFSLFTKQSKGVKSRLLVVGDGPEKENLKNRIFSLKADNDVVFTGFRYDVPRLLNAFDVFVLPSKTEGSPIALLEAMASGKAIVASNIPAIREIVENGKEAILFEPTDVELLKESLRRLYDDSSLRRTLGENARKRAKQYDVDCILQKVLSVVEKLTSANSNL
jgi:glycosyltransferase involved in cell wall biosynthesis